jgi:hypothetical protein
LYRIELPSNWTDSAGLEAALSAGSGPHATLESAIHVNIPAGCKLMVDASVRLLSLANQLQSLNRRVTMEFSREDTQGFGYLDRIGFFDELDKKIIVKPDRPRSSAAARYHGSNSGLVEIARLVPGKIDGHIPRRLEKALTAPIKNGNRRERLGNAAHNLFAELIGNVQDHSNTQIAGYAVLQVYKNGVRIAVSDSGEGLLHTLQGSLAEHYPHLERLKLEPRDLILRALREGGLSRCGKGRGTGLKSCAEHARTLQANLEIRTANHCLRVRGKHWARRANDAQMSEKLPLIWGTHVVFDFQLD